MSLGLSMYDCCGYGDCTVTIRVRGCGINLEGYAVSIWYWFVVVGSAVETKTTDADGLVTFTIPGSAVYSFYVQPPYGAAFNGYQLDGYYVFCPGSSLIPIDLHPAEGSGCTDCAPVPQPSDLSLSLPGFGLSPTTTDGSRWVIDWPIPDCPDNGCTAPTMGVSTTVVYFQLNCSLTDGYYYLSMYWLTRGYDSGIDYPEFDSTKQCPQPWVESDTTTGFPGTNTGGAQLGYVIGYFKSSFVAGSGSFFVLFDPTFYFGVIGGGAAVADPFTTLLCTTGSFVPTVSQT